MPCERHHPVEFVGWNYPLATIAGRERQAAEWCWRCGALGVWSEDGYRVEWFRPGVLGEMPDCSAQDAPRTPFRDPGAGVVAGTEGEGMRGWESGFSKWTRTVSERAVALQEQALLEWAVQAGVRPETLVAAGIIPRVKTDLRGDQVVITVEASKLPMRERGESEAEFVERVRRMPR